MSNSLALRAFFYDFCVISTNHNLSRGFLSGLEPLALRLGLESDLAKACQAVGFVCHAKPKGSPRLMQVAEALYQELLSSMTGAIQRPETANATETRLIITLLGLYEVCFHAIVICVVLNADSVQLSVASETNPGYHDAHAKGLIAVLRTAGLPISRLGTVQYDPLRNLQVSNHSHLNRCRSLKCSGSRGVLCPGFERTIRQSG